MTLTSFEDSAPPPAMSDHRVNSPSKFTDTTDVIKEPPVPAELKADSTESADMASAALFNEHLPPSFKPRSFKPLPTEILDNIFAQLDTPPPSESTLYDQPEWGITSYSIDNLKSASLVSRRWRQVVLPYLFKHACLVIQSPGVFAPIMRDDYVALTDFVRTHNLKSCIMSFTLCIRTTEVTQGLPDAKDFANNDLTLFWLNIFEALDPPEVKILCDPQLLGILTGCEVNTANSYRYDMPYHLLRLQRPQGSGPFQEYVPKEQKPCAEEVQADMAIPLFSSVLFEIRPWYSLLLNEGSFVRGYRMYDFHEYEPPSILTQLIGEVHEGTHLAQIPPTVRDFSYIAIFPSSSHFHQITRFCPRLDRLYCQFVPRNDVLRDKDEMQNIDANEMWLERNSCYAYVMREIFSSPPQGNYRYLKEFESGDAADADAWEMAVEYVKRAGGGWVVEKPGVFVKIENEGDDATSLDDANDPSPMQGVDENPSLFQGQLRRWAFTGVTTLPISSLSLYFRPQGWGDE